MLDSWNHTVYSLFILASFTYKYASKGFFFHIFFMAWLLVYVSCWIILYSVDIPESIYLFNYGKNLGCLLFKKKFLGGYSWFTILCYLGYFQVWRDYESVQFSSVHSLSRVQLFATPWIAAREASLSITNSQSSLRHTSIESVMPCSHLILGHPLLLLPLIPPSIRVFQWVNSSHDGAKVLELQL